MDRKEQAILERQLSIIEANLHSYMLLPVIEKGVKTYIEQGKTKEAILMCNQVLKLFKWLDNFKELKKQAVNMQQGGKSGGK